MTRPALSEGKKEVDQHSERLRPYWTRGFIPQTRRIAINPRGPFAVGENLSRPSIGLACLKADLLLTLIDRGHQLLEGTPHSGAWAQCKCTAMKLCHVRVSTWKLQLAGFVCHLNFWHWLNKRTNEIKETLLGHHMKSAFETFGWSRSRFCWLGLSHKKHMWILKCHRSQIYLNCNCLKGVF